MCPSLIRRVRQDAVSLLFLFFSPFRYLPYGGFHVAAQLLRQFADFHLFRFLRRLGKILVHGYFRGVHRRLCAAQPYPDFLVPP